MLEGQRSKAIHASQVWNSASDSALRGSRDLDVTERLERLTLSGGSRRATFGVPALGAQFPGYIIEQAVNTQRCRDKRLLVTIVDHDF